MSRKGRDNLLKRCGCRERSWATCTHPWYFRMEHNGRLFSMALYKGVGDPRGTRYTKQEAEAHRDRLRADIVSGTYQPRTRAMRQPDAATPTPALVLTVTDIFGRYVAARAQDASRRPHRNERLASELAVIARTEIPAGPSTTIPFGELVFEEIRRHHIDAYREARRAHYRAAEAAATRRSGTRGRAASRMGAERPGRARGETGINRHLQTLRALFNWATRNEYRTHESPFRFRGTPDIRLAKEQARSRRLDESEERRLLLAANPHLQACIIAALETGMRKGEILGLRWSDVRFEGDRPEWIILRADGTKTGKSRSIPVSDTLAELLLARRNDPAGEPMPPTAFVFGTAVGTRHDSIKVAWAGTCRRAGIDGLCFHDLRREAGSRYSEAGVPLHHLRELLGHANIATTSRYLSVAPVELRRSLALAAEQRNASRRSAG